MRILLVLACSSGALFAQHQGNTNSGYRTEEGRAALGRTLSAPDRDTRQKPGELIAALKIQPGMTVADLGTGTGYMLPFLSRAVGPKGRVLAEDVFPDFLDKARAHAADRKLSNVDFVLGTDRDVKLPAGSVDLALTLDAYHHFDHPAEMLRSIRSALKPGGRLVIVDYYKRKTAMGGRAPDHIRLDQDNVVREVESNGFRVVEVREHIPGEQYLAVFEIRP